ncbi:hypothetical protein TS85_11380 [Sphingomonas hengshuiensis]|uniref:Uncharacterized protein n=1 Tax=Sphingomonas hengshuiensis TaxID=1609977 RepID=A0A7U4J8Q5_9SPHN|nr:hypothetical protein TS85_11380 [Sphingomonas hengshuiensis]
MRRKIAGFDAETVTLEHPITLEQKTIGREAFSAWCEGSDRRSYIGDDGDWRTRIGMFDRPVLEPETGEQALDADGNPVTEPMVQFIRLEGGVVTVPRDEWAAWRAQAE